MIRDVIYLLRAIMVMRRMRKGDGQPFRRAPDWMVRRAIELDQREDDFMRRYTWEAQREAGLRQAGFR